MIDLTRRLEAGKGSKVNLLPVLHQPESFQLDLTPPRRRIPAISGAVIAFGVCVTVAVSVAVLAH